MPVSGTCEYVSLSVGKGAKAASRVAAWMRPLRAMAALTLVLAALLTASIIVSSTPVAAQQGQQIAVEGNRRVEADTIRSYFRLAPGERLDSFKTDQALKALYATGLFQDVRITPGPGGRITVTVIENPVINRVAFEGNRKIKDDQLTNEVQSKARGTLSRPTVQSDVQRITEIYRRNGRFDVTIEPKIIELPNNRVDLVFEIREGDKTSVKKLRFNGNNNFRDQRLKDEIKTSETFPVLGFLQSADIYDPDRIEADRDLIRRFYLKHGYADVRVVSAVSVYEPALRGFVVTFTIEEGARYRFGKVDIQSNIAVVDANALYGRLRASSGGVYNAESVEKSVERLSIEVARRGYPFAVVRPRGDRHQETAIIDVTFTVEDGPRIYIERINVRGNTRTRDYVIRREFDIGEGDAYNRALVDRAERRLRNLGYFKTVKISNEPGSAPDRVVLNVDVEDQPTGEFSVAGGYSTADGFMAEVSVGERNLLGQGQYAKAAVQYGQRARGFELSYAEPFFLGYRVGVGADLYVKQTLASTYISYDSKTVGGALRAGFAVTEEFSTQFRYNLYRQEISLPTVLNNCQFSPNAPPGGPGVSPQAENDYAAANPPYVSCYADGEASLAARRELSQGPVWVSSVGYTISYNTLDNIRAPTTGISASISQDFAGVGGDVNFIRTSGDLRTYYELFSEVVGVLHLQAGNIAGWGEKDLRMLDHFQMGPNVVRGFAPAGIGPRDMTVGSNQDPLGGTMYWGASIEAQSPISFIPKDVGIKMAVFADAGSLWDYRGPTGWNVTGETLNVGSSNMVIRSSVGAGLIWNSPFGPLRFDYSYPITKWCGTASNGSEVCDRIQQFRFGGGTKF